MGENYKLTYNVDMVFCIDCTGSMDSIIDIVKKNALNFYGDVHKKMDAKNKKISQLRVRIVAFRDYLADNENAMLVTDFFKLPEQEKEFETSVKSLTASGGGDKPEDGLEALAYAIRSKWDNSSMKKRQVIVVYTDDATHDLGYGKESEFYPKGMPKDLSELYSWWGDAGNSSYINNDAKRLILFAPDLPAWNEISQNWDNVLHFPSTAGDGLSSLQYEQIIDTISNSI